MIKCDYCSKNATSIHNNELLCETHGKVLAPEIEIQKKVRNVPTTSLERKLKKKYLTLMSYPQTKEQFDGLIEDFKIDADIIRNTNLIYSEL